MARAETPKRSLAPDMRYNSVEIARLIHCVMRDGKKSQARRIVYGSFDLIQEKLQEDPLAVFAKAKEHVAPRVEVRALRLGGANLQVPRAVSEVRRMQLFLRWIVGAAQQHRKDSMMASLAHELISASKGEGHAVKRRMRMDKSAQSHRAYSHFR